MNTEDYKKAVNFWLDKERKEMPVELLKPAVEEFLSSSNVCALATDAGDYVRCTPLEYSYHDDKFWIFTEGGEKFIGLEANKNVSLAVFEKNPNFDELKSVQVMGVAETVKPMSSEYVAHAEYKKVPVSTLQKLADAGNPMYLLCITPTRMDVLFSAFKEQGYDSRQRLDCDEAGRPIKPQSALMWSLEATGLKFASTCSIVKILEILRFWIVVFSVAGDYSNSDRFLALAIYSIH